MPWCTEHCRPATPPQPKRPRTARRYLPSPPWSRTNNQLMKTKKAVTQSRTRASRVLGTTCRDRYPTKRSGTRTKPMNERIKTRPDRARSLPQPPPDTTPSGRPASACSADGRSARRVLGRGERPDAVGPYALGSGRPHGRETLEDHCLDRLRLPCALGVRRRVDRLPHGEPNQHEADEQHPELQGGHFESFIAEASSTKTSTLGWHCVSSG